MLYNLVILDGSEQHSCMPKGAQAREIDIEVEDMSAKMYERATLNPHESLMLSPEAVEPYNLLQLIPVI